MGQALPGRSLLGRMRFLGAVLSVGALLALSLTSCGASVSGSGAPPTAPHATASAPLGTRTAAATATPIITPAPSAGWATYRDPRFSFQVPFPPGWQPASLTWPPQPEKGGYNYYIVQFFPPGPHGAPGPGASAYAPELIQMTVALSGTSTESLAQIPGSSPEPGTVALGTTQVQLHDSGSPGNGGEIGRAAETTLGTYRMVFLMHYLANEAWNPAIAQRGIALFLAMLKSYHPA